MSRHRCAAGRKRRTRPKLETDANFKRMLLEGLRRENLEAVRLGIASHNLFEVAFALVTALEDDVLEYLQFEMLEGMANHQRRALFEVCSSLLLYAPACQRDDFIHAIGYLVRRLDENTGQDNFLRHAFKLEVGSPDWDRLETDVCRSLPGCVRPSPTRHAARRTASQPPQPIDGPPSIRGSSFGTSRTPTSRWFRTRSGPRSWSRTGSSKRLNQPGRPAAGNCRPGGDRAERRVVESLDPSRPGVVIGRYRQANGDDIDGRRGLRRDDEDGWRSMDHGPAIRASCRQAAQQLREARGDLMGIALAEGGKTLLESDPEVSEAVDFVEFYSRTADEFRQLEGLAARRRKGVVVVVSPWNFPIAIPCGGVAAALAAGNTVILKPASDTVLTAHRMCECFWQAGVSRKALQLVPCSGAAGGSATGLPPATWTSSS